MSLKTPMYGNRSREPSAPELMRTCWSFEFSECLPETAIRGKLWISGRSPDPAPASTATDHCRWPVSSSVLASPWTEPRLTAAVVFTAWIKFVCTEWLPWCCSGRWHLAQSSHGRFRSWRWWAAVLFTLWGMRQVASGELEIRSNPLFAPMLLFGALILWQLVTRTHCLSRRHLFCSPALLRLWTLVLPGSSVLASNITAQEFGLDSFRIRFCHRHICACCRALPGTANSIGSESLNPTAGSTAHT